MAARGGFIMKRIWLTAIGLVAGILIMLETGWAVTPERLKEIMDQGDKVTIIDVRGTGMYSQGHILGAINIPSSIIAMKRLPPIGDVIVYGDGIRTDLTVAAVDELNTRTGIRAEMLEGGFAAWEALNFSTTHKAGLGRMRVQYLTYQDLEKAAAHNPDIVLVDLRSKTFSDKTSADVYTDSTQVSPETFTDLSEKFPGRLIIRPDRKRGSSGKQWDIASSILKGKKGPHHRYHYVIIDNGDGEGQKVASRLFAAGVKRVAILTGGEQILRREGQPGRMKKERKQRLQENY